MFTIYFLSSIFYYLFSEIKGLPQTVSDKVFLTSDNSVFRKNEDLLQNLETEKFLLLRKLKQLVPEEGSSNDEIPQLILPEINDCLEGGSNSLCSNKGLCVDNKCVCNSTVFEIDNTTTVLYRYSGKYCEECPFCGAQRCHQYLPCIECHSFQKPETCAPYCHFQYEIVDEVFRDVDKDEKYCNVENSGGCFFKFKYSYDSQNLVVVHYEKQFSCLDGTKFVIFTFLGVIVYIFALALLVSQTCWLAKETEEYKSTTTLSRRYDVLRRPNCQGQQT